MAQWWTNDWSEVGLKHLNTGKSPPLSLWVCMWVPEHIQSVNSFQIFSFSSFPPDILVSSLPIQEGSWYKIGMWIGWASVLPHAWTYPWLIQSRISQECLYDCLISLICSNSGWPMRSARFATSGYWICWLPQFIEIVTTDETGRHGIFQLLLQIKSLSSYS